MKAPIELWNTRDNGENCLTNTERKLAERQPVNPRALSIEYISVRL